MLLYPLVPMIRNCYHILNISQKISEPHLCSENAVGKSSILTKVKIFIIISLINTLIKWHTVGNTDSQVVIGGVSAEVILRPASPIDIENLNLLIRPDALCAFSCSADALCHGYELELRRQVHNSAILH